MTGTQCPGSPKVPFPCHPGGWTSGSLCQVPESVVASAWSSEGARAPPIPHTTTTSAPAAWGPGFGHAGGRPARAPASLLHFPWGTACLTKVLGVGWECRSPWQRSLWSERAAGGMASMGCGGRAELPPHSRDLDDRHFCQPWPFLSPRPPRPATPQREQMGCSPPERLPGVDSPLVRQ